MTLANDAVEDAPMPREHHQIVELEAMTAASDAAEDTPMTAASDAVEDAPMTLRAAQPRMHR